MMLSKKQICDSINHIEQILVKYDIPYKLLDNQDGTRWGIRWNNMFYVYPCNDNGNELCGGKNATQFIYLIGLDSAMYKYDDIDILYRQIELDLKLLSE